MICLTHEYTKKMISFAKPIYNSQTKMEKYRIESDLLGELKVPADAYYGVQTQRALNN